MSRELPSDHRNLIPPPDAVLERLASNLRESRLLRSLLRLSRRAAQDRTSQQGNPLDRQIDIQTPHADQGAVGAEVKQ